MAVYTKINSKDLLFLSRDYKLGKIIKSEGIKKGIENTNYLLKTCLLYTSPSPRDVEESRMPSSA